MKQIMRSTFGHLLSKNWVLVATFICGSAVFTACTNDSEDNPVTPAPPAADDVRMTNLFILSLNPQGDTLSTTTEDLIWEDGLLKHTQVQIVLKMAGRTITTSGQEEFFYDGKDCTEIIGNIFHSYFTYENGRITSAIERDVEDNSMSRRITITDYTDDGHVSRMKSEFFHEDGSQVVREYALTWENGDMVMLVIHPVEPAGEDETYEYEYDNFPSVYTGYPLAQCIWSPDEIAYRNSKHNLKSNDEGYIYKNGLLVSYATVSGSSVSFITYSDGTSGR